MIYANGLQQLQQPGANEIDSPFKVKQRSQSSILKRINHKGYIAGSRKSEQYSSMGKYNIVIPDGVTKEVDNRLMLQGSPLSS